MNNKNITFIGAGNMAYSLIGGLIDNQFPANHISAIDPNQAQLDKLKTGFAIKTASNNGDSAALLQHSDCVVLAVKPQVMQAVIAEYHTQFTLDNTLFISIAAGISSHSLQKWLSADSAIVRCMPNTPALVQAGASVLYANQHVTDTQKNLASDILATVGTTNWTDDEHTLHAVTATSGSGPAYFFLLMEQMQASAEAMGLDPQQARSLVTQTAFGAAKMALESEHDLATLRANVTSKGGTTAAALDTFADANFNQIVKRALATAEKRSQEMATLFDN